MRVTVLGEDVRVAFAGEEGAQDREARRADDVADDAREQEVHLGERLLHPLDRGAGGLDEDVAVTHEGAEGADRSGGAEAAAQEPDTVEFAEPRTILDVALAAGDVFDVAGVDEQDLQAPRFEDVVDRDPVDGRTAFLNGGPHVSCWLEDRFMRAYPPFPGVPIEFR